jgi:hypothetical protein
MTPTERGRMGSSSKRQTTMAKMARERALQEKRALKQQKKEERKRAKAEGAETPLPEAVINEEAPDADPVAAGVRESVEPPPAP